ncbi:acetyl-CoA acetyltransferase [Photobacterium angustum S14]|uniref:Acetyl-CoA acetyltransferase n=1 Tax=Photobacterium angustum (strain S14 / CCUG 15956) TaxID=314292 RepID=Q1ZPC2_PHOAS|nr:acetyl-CoA acetyltransferase [Photobacterium angustum S14]
MNKSINIKLIANQENLIGESKVSLQKEVVILLNR